MAKRAKDADPWIRTFEVSEPTKHRKGFTVYKVTSTLFPKSFPESATKITVWKRYSDFRKLHKDLEQIFKQLYLRGGEFPVFPKAKLFGRFEHEVVEERRRAALVLLHFTSQHIQLFTSKAFIQFFENGYKSEDFIGRVLFNREESNGKDEPPTTVLQERSDLNTLCLEPERLWKSNSKPSTDEDCRSLSLSSISSSLSPDNPEVTLSTPSHNGNPLPSTSSKSNGSLLNGSTTMPCQENVLQVQPMAKSSTTASPSVAVEDVSMHNKEHNKKMSETPVNSQHFNSSSFDSSQNGDVLDGSFCSSSKPSTSQGNNGIVRSATVTDDLSAYFEDEFEDAAFLFPTGSCASLDALPGFTPSSDDAESVNSKASSSSYRTGLFSLTRKKNGFGLFDFLPLFPKKAKKKLEKKPKEEVTKKELVAVGYICEAAGHFAVAQFHESNMEFEDAFAAYKEGIRVLLAGAQDDSDRDRKVLAKNKLEKYLSRAESLKETYLSPGVPNEGTGAISPVFSSPNKKEKYLSSLSQKSVEGSNKPISGHSLLTNFEELKMFKVVGRIPWKSNVLIVMNPEEQIPKCYAAKVLWKSPCIIFPDKPTIIPNNIPYMTKLQKWFETSEKIILLLEYIGGGRLIDFVTNYQSKRISFVTAQDEEPVDEQNFAENVTNDALSESNTNGISSTTPALNVTENFDRTGAFSRGDNDGALETLYLKVTDETIICMENSLESPEENTSDYKAHTGTIPPPVTPLVSEKIDSFGENETERLNGDLLEVSKLLENSKALLKTVTKTLEEGSSSASPWKPPNSIKAPVQERRIQDSDSGAQIDRASTSVECDQSVQGNQVQSISKVPKSDTEAPQPIDSEKKGEELIQPDSDDPDPIIPKRMVPDGCIKEWAAEMVIALEALHAIGITYGDLDINDILLGENGHISLRYKSLWKEVDDPFISNLYMAPEVRYSIGIPLWTIHPSADWWSLGAILFCLFTGQSFHSLHPEGIFPEMVLKVPDVAISGSAISRSAQTLLTELLHFTPELRLGYYGAAEIKTHPFFEGFDWDRASEESSNSNV